MALAKNWSGEMCLWNIRESNNVRSKLPKIIGAPEIDYKSLQWLCNSREEKSKDSHHSEREQHEIFMQNYRKMFVPKPSKTGVPLSIQRANLSSSGLLGSQGANTSVSDHRPGRKMQPVQEYTHNIQDYLRLLHKERKSEDRDLIRTENLRTLRHILRKHPFERTPGENGKIFSALQSFDFFLNQVDPAILKDLSAVAYMEAWKETDFSVYGKTGIHMILKGSVIPVSEPYLTADMEHGHPQTFASLKESDLENSSSPRLLPGDCFGTWLQYDDPYTREFSVVTTEPNCELMKISVNDYKRVITQIKHRKHGEKLSLLVSCQHYKLWPRQPLISLVDSLEWATYPPNSVLMSEGHPPPFIGFIRSGTCHVLKQVQALCASNKEQRMKQVVVGRLGRFDSFAEISLLLDEPVTCSVVTATIVELGMIRPDKVKNLDEVIRQLILQSSTRTFGNLTKEDIQNEYLQQEMARKWNEFKHAQVLQVISANGIRPGYGKWAK